MNHQNPLSNKIYTELAPDKMNALLNIDAFFKYYKIRYRNSFVLEFAKVLRCIQQKKLIDNKDPLIIQKYKEFIIYDNNCIYNFFYQLDKII